MDSSITQNSNPTVQERNNVMRHTYKPLTTEEQNMMNAVKDVGLQMWNVVDNIEKTTNKSRELSLAKTKIEEAVMWATKHITA